MPVGLVAGSVTDHTRVEVCDGLGPVCGDKNSEVVYLPVFFERGHVLRAYTCRTSLIGYS